LFAVGLHTCTAVARSLCVSWAFLYMLVLACSAGTDMNMAENASWFSAHTTNNPRSSDDADQHCFTSGMDIINMYSYTPVRSVLVHCLDLYSMDTVTDVVYRRVAWSSVFLSNWPGSIS